MKLVILVILIRWCFLATTTGNQKGLPYRVWPV